MTTYFNVNLRGAPHSFLDSWIHFLLFLCAFNRLINKFRRGKAVQGRCANLTSTHVNPCTLISAAWIDRCTSFGLFCAARHTFELQLPKAWSRRDYSVQARALVEKFQPSFNKRLNMRSVAGWASSTNIHVALLVLFRSRINRTVLVPNIDSDSFGNLSLGLDRHRLHWIRPLLFYQQSCR